MAHVSSIDDVLMGVTTHENTTTPEAVEDKDESHEYDEPETPANTEEDEPESSSGDDEAEQEVREIDDYGNEKSKPKMYSEEEVNERINKAVRDRFSRGQFKEQQHSEPVRQDGQSESDWQQELESFVEKTVSKMTAKQQQQAVQQAEDEAQAELQSRFHSGMGRFSDFEQVVGSQPITDAMTYALRAINDPSAFIYAASKRESKELERISRLKDPYAQIVEMGKLEERLRKPKSNNTNAPRPGTRISGDMSNKEVKKKKEQSFDDILRQEEAKRKQQILNRTKRA